jgi:hypothetical protein
VPSFRVTQESAGCGRRCTIGLARRGAGLLLLIAVGSFPGAASADVRPPIEIQIAGPVRAARAGKPFRGTLVVRAYAEIRLDSLRLTGDGWRILRLRSPGPRWLSRRAPVRIPFVAVPSDSSRPLVVRAVVAGSPFEKWLDLSPQAVERARVPGPVTSHPNQRSP